MKFAKPKGTNDIYGKEMNAWHYIEGVIAELCKNYSISEIRTPMYEQADLFVRTIGETTDIVTKEMFSFTDSGGREYVLRPEGTANAARAYIENGVSGEAQPTKWYYISPAFRAERPQKGRYRQFTQFGVEYFGSYEPSADAELISVGYALLRRLGITNAELHINSLGGDKCRAKYNEVLKKYIGENINNFCATCRERFEKNPLRVLDCKSETCQAMIAGAPAPVDNLDEECRLHFDSVCQSLENMGIPFVIDPLCVRGLDYYTKTVFEFISPDLGAQSTVCGGGRYDKLVGECGGAETGAVGFGLGLERLAIILTEKGLLPELKNNAAVYLGSVGEKGSAKARELTFALRQKKLSAECDIVGRSVKAQFRYADKIRAEFVAILGDDEVDKGVVRIKRMATGEENEVAVGGIVEWVSENIGKR